MADSARATVIGGEQLWFVGAYRLQAGNTGTASSHLSPLGHALVAFKDRGDRYAGRCLAELFASHCSAPARTGQLVVAIPSDLERLRRRGFSPAAWLARALAARTGAPLSTNALVRAGQRPAQRALGGAARRSNARGAFRLGVERLHGYQVVLVDDVATTGATLCDAASRLREGGAASVVCTVLACADDEVLFSCRSKTASTGRSDTGQPHG